MGSIMSASVRRAGRVAALVLGGVVAAVVAPPAQAAVTLFVSGTSQGAVNKYVDGVLVGQIAPVGNNLGNGVELGPDGLVYVDHVSGSSIQAYNPTTITPVGSPFTVQSNGGSSFATGPLAFGSPTTPAGGTSSLYVALMSNDSIQKINTTTGVASNFIGQQSGGMRVPKDILAIGNSLYVSAFNTTGNPQGSNGSVLLFDATTGAFQNTFIAPGQNGLLGPVGIAMSPDGNILVSGYDSNNVLKYSPTGTFLGTLIAPGSGLQNPTDMQVDADNGLLYVASDTEASVRTYNPLTGAYLGYAVAPGAGGLVGASSLAVFGTSASAVPLPSGAWAGLVTLGLLAAGYGVQRRRTMA